MFRNAEYEPRFPAAFDAAQLSLASRRARGPGASCIARWEDDGGRTADEPAPGRHPARRRPGAVAAPV